MMVIRNTISKSRPDLVNEIYRMLRASRRMVPPPAGSLVDPWRFGVEANRGSLEIIIHYSFRQKLISRMFLTQSGHRQCRRHAVLAILLGLSGSLRWSIGSTIQKVKL